MARKLDCETRIGYLCAEIYKLESRFAKGDERSGLNALRIRLALSMKDRMALARLEEKFATEAIKWHERIQGAAEATRIFYDRYPERDERTDYQKQHCIPLESDIADIVANFIDGGQQTNEGRLLLDRLKEIINPRQQKWLNIKELKKEEVEEIEEFLRKVIF